MRNQTETRLKLEASTQIDCLVIAGTDPLTGKLRRGPYLRVLNPPVGVHYVVRTERLTYPKLLAHYKFSPLNTCLNTFRFFAEHLIPPKQGSSDYSIVHSFFWNLDRFKTPWIHENDQSLGQFADNYLHLNDFVRRKITEAYAKYLNLPACKRVIVWSQNAKNGYIQDGVESSKISVIPPPFPVVHDHRPHGENINMLFIGRDYNRKGGDIMLNIMERLNKDFDNHLKLFYVGSVDDKEAVRKIRENKKHIAHYPNPPDNILYDEIFPVSDIFVLPTRADAFAISVVEAMSRGIPVVASNISALPEIVEDGISGFLVRPDDVDSFSKCLARLIEDPGKRKEIGDEARRQVGQRFSSQRIGKALRRVYEDAL
jgi:glycosyltransferase involved in cell wall biosynthesis